MPLYRPSELRAFLADEGVIALPSLSQNFLIDGNVVAKIRQLLDLSPNEPILEIGPGPGVVTEDLSQQFAQILTIEKDAAFARTIERFSGVKSLHGDALKLDLTQAARSHFSASFPIKLISNLPFATASSFLSRLLLQGATFRTLTLMLPRDIADKMRGKCGPHWLFAAQKIFCKTAIWHSVSRHCFYPKPQIDAVLAHFELCQVDSLTCQEAPIFLQWLKSICSLKKRKGNKFEVYHTPEQRAQISPAQWLKLWKESTIRSEHLSQ